MQLSAKATTVEQIAPWRDLYRQEMSCQIVHDSLHARKGWTQPFLLFAGEVTAGYGSIAVGGPWKGKPTVFEFYIRPHCRSLAFDLFTTLLTASGAIRIEIQSNDALISVMLHTFGHNIASESILFHDQLTTAHKPQGAIFRRVTAADRTQISSQKFDSASKWAVEVNGTVGATGDILFHYNRPYGDIYMAVAEPLRKRGLGSYLVQELKRVCYEQGSIPSARCNPNNIASRKTLQKAGFVPCGHILTGSVSP